MRVSVLPICLVALSMSTGCAYQVPANIKPVYSSYTSYGEKVPLKAAVFVEASKAKEDVRVTGLACSAHKFPLDAEQDIKIAVAKTLDNVFENTRLVDQPITINQFDREDVNAMVIVKLEDMDVDLTVIPNFLTADMKSLSEVSFGVTLDTKQGRKLGFTASGTGKASAPAGGACEGGAIAIGDSLQESLSDALAEIGQNISNSPRLR